MKRHVAPGPRRGALLALLVVASSCGGSAPDAGSSAVAPDTIVAGPATRQDLAGVAFDVRRDPG